MKETNNNKQDNKQNNYKPIDWKAVNKNLKKMALTIKQEKVLD